MSDVNTMPRVSVVLPTYRRPDYMLRAVESIRAQTIEDWELIIVDDNDPTSPERRATESAVEALLSDPRIRYVQHSSNQGGSAARNTGIRATRSPFIAFLDDDDEWAARKLEAQLELFEGASSNLALVYCQIRVRDTRTGHETMFNSDGRSHSVSDLLRRNTIGTTSSILCRAKALRSVGLFDASLPSRQDLDLYVRLAEHHEFAWVPEPLVTLHLHDRPSIGKNHERAVRAHQLFAEKHRRLIESDPEHLRVVRYQLGYNLVAAKRYREARAVLAKAWRAKPSDSRVFLRLMLTFWLFRSLHRPAKWVLLKLGGANPPYTKVGLVCPVRTRPAATPSTTPETEFDRGAGQQGDPHHGRHG